VTAGCGIKSCAITVSNASAVTYECLYGNTAKPEKAKKGLGTLPEHPRSSNTKKINERAQNARALAVPEVFHASQRDLGNFVPIRKTKTRTKKAWKKSVFAVLTSPRNRQELWSGIWGMFWWQRGYSRFFPDRVARGQVKFVLSTGPVPARVPQRSLRLSPPLHHFSNGDSLPQLDGVASCCCKTGRTGPAWLNERRRRLPVTFPLPLLSTHLPICLFGGGADSALTSCQFLFCAFCCLLHPLPLKRVTTPTAFRNTPERKKGPNRLARPPSAPPATISQLRIYGCTWCTCRCNPITGHNYEHQHRCSTVQLHKTTLSPWAALPPYGYISFIPSSFAKKKRCYVLLSSQMRCKVDHALPSSWGPSSKTRVLSSARLGATNQEKRPTMRTHTWHKQRMTTATTNKLLHPPSK